MKHSAACSLYLFLMVFLCVPVFGQALPASDGGFIPIAELRQALDERLLENPGDAMALYELGRVDCFVYAFNREYFPALKDSADPYPDWEVQRHANIPLHTATLLLPLPQWRLNHLVDAVLHLQQCVALDPELVSAREFLGYAYEQLSHRCASPKWIRGRLSYDEAAAEAMGERMYWEELALAEYRAVRMARESNPDPGRGTALTLGNMGILTILRGREPKNPEEIAEIEAIAPKARPNELMISPKHLVEMEARYPEIPLGSNAAQYYLHAGDALIEISADTEEHMPISGQFKISMPPEPFSEVTRALMRQSGLLNKEALRLVHEAASIPQSRYPIDLSQGHAMELSHLGRLRQLARITAVQALSAAEAQDAGQSVQYLMDSLAVGQSLLKEPVLISQLVRWACGGIAMDALEQVANRTELSESQLAQLQGAVTRLEDLHSIKIALESEAWLAEFTLAPLDMEEALKEDSRYGSGLFGPSGLDSFSPSDQAAPADDLESREARFRAHYEKTAAQFEEMQAKRRELVSTYLAHAAAGIRSLQDLVRLPEDFDPQNPAASMKDDGNPSPAVPRAITAFVRYTTRLRVVQTALAAQRFERVHGRFPATLEELVPQYLAAETLVDPYNGESLQIQASDDRFVVYSVVDAMFNEIAKTRYESEAPSAISFTVVW